MSRINGANWTKERIQAFWKFLSGDKDAKFRGRKSSGEMHKYPTSVAKLIDYYKPLQFSTKKGSVLVTGGGFERPRVILTDEGIKKKAIALYKHKENGLGKAPSIYNWMKLKYANLSYRKVESAIKSLASYQKYQARHVKKQPARKVIASTGPGEDIDTDLMSFSTKGKRAYYDKRHNEGFTGLAVVVDRFSGYLAVAPWVDRKQTAQRPGGKSAAVIAGITSRMIQAAEFPSKRGGTIFHDNGVEYGSVFPGKMRDIGYTSVVVSKTAGAPSAHAERAVGIIRKLINIKLTADGTKAKAKTQSWWPLARKIVQNYNNSPMTDVRAPYTPNQLKRFRGARLAEIRRKMNAQGFKRVSKAPSRITPDGARVSKVLSVLSVGDRVRYAVEHVRKTGANKRPYPKQRWSDSIHRVEQIIIRKLGFANYRVSRLPKRRFEREDLQKVQ